nr:hypothetical protein [Actinomycetota bacterium]
LADRVAAAVGQRLALSNAPPVTPPAAPAPPTHIDAEAVAAAVSAELQPLLESLAAPMPAEGDGTWVAQATLMSAAEQLHLHLEAFGDRVRAGSRSLEALADELNARERTASGYADRLAQSITANMERLGRRLEDRIEDRDSGHHDHSDLLGLLETLNGLVARLDGVPSGRSASISSLRPPDAAGA